MQCTIFSVGIQRINFQHQFCLVTLFFLNENFFRIFNPLSKNQLPIPHRLPTKKNLVNQDTQPGKPRHTTDGFYFTNGNYYALNLSSMIFKSPL